jgi:antitoxin component HigA of HigAB toxin-antitoxin module
MDPALGTLKVDVMNISPIKSQRDYRKVLKEIEGLMSAKRNTPDGDRLDVLVTLVEAWERKHYRWISRTRWRRLNIIWIRMGFSLATSFHLSAAETVCTRC